MAPQLGRSSPESNRAVILTGIIGILLILILANLLGPFRGWTLTVAALWTLVVAAVIALLAVIGKLRLGRPGGILISDRNLMSLTRFQIIGWTVLIGSALLAAGVARVFDPHVKTLADALNIDIPAEVWQLLGISGGSTVLSNLVKSGKKQKEPAQERKVTEKTASLLRGETPQNIRANREGLLYVNNEPSDARFMDMLEGDEIANTAYLDIGKVQMFLFTVFALLMYGASLWQLFFKTDPAAITALPGLTQMMVTIIGTSHAAYLGTKWIDQTPVDPNATPGFTDAELDG